MKDTSNSFKEFIKTLTESPIVAYGDMTEPEDFRNSIQVLGLEKYWTELPKMKKTYVFTSNNKREIIFGEYNEDGKNFDIYCRLLYSEMNLQKPGYKKAIEIDSIFIGENFRINGLATRIYTHLTKLGFTVVSGGMQFLGARRLWAKLSRELVVDIIDIDDMEILETNHTLEHGLNDFEYPRKYYSEYDFSYNKYRFVLKSIK